MPAAPASTSRSATAPTTGTRCAPSPRKSSRRSRPSPGAWRLARHPGRSRSPAGGIGTSPNTSTGVSPGQPPPTGRASHDNDDKLRRMPCRAVTLRAVTTLFLERQHLAQPQASALTAGRLRRFAEDVGGIQLDSINVLDRAHYLTIWSRFGPYDRAWLDRQVYRRRLLFEYWAHAACLVPASDLPWWRRAMLDYQGRHTGWSGWLRRNGKMLQTVREAVQANGPMGNGDFEGRRPAGGGGWWSWRPVQHALHHLWMTGALTIHSRQHFHKRYDLLARALPDALLGVEPVSSEEFQHW